MSGSTELTGNDYVSLPVIDAEGGVDGVGVLHGALAGLVEWWGPGGGTPLLRPRLLVDGAAIALAGAAWRRLDRWIPTCSLTLSDSSSIVLTICAPQGYPPARGFFIKVDIENKGRRPVDVELALDVAWLHSIHCIATARPMPGRNDMHAEDGMLVLATDGGRGPALAIACTHEAEIIIDNAGEGAATDGDTLRATLVQRFTATPQRRSSATVYIGAGRERDGAAVAAAALRRTGADAWLRQSRMELSHIVRAGHDHRWGDTLNRNLLFNRFCAVGRGIDDDRLYLLRSRSTRCAAPAVFNEREALFWTLPALIVADAGLAREALMRTLELFSERSGEYSRYVDGGALDAGFALDQLLLYPWAIQHYVKATDDTSLLEEPLVRQVLHEIDTGLFMRLHPQHMLCATELLPSGDAADHPFTTFANALLWAYCQALPTLWPAGGPEEPASQFEGAAAEVSAAIWQHLTTEIDGGPVFASSASLEGEAAVYDDPLGSLALLPFFGFCGTDDPVWISTMEFLRSRRYPLWREGAVSGLADRSDPHAARLPALCADLLGPALEEALDRLLRISLPGGLAASSYDPATGGTTDHHHAALAGLLAWTLIRAAEGRAAARPRKPRR